MKVIFSLYEWVPLPSSSYRTSFVIERETTLILYSKSNSLFVQSNISVETGGRLLVFCTLMISHYNSLPIL